MNETETIRFILQNSSEPVIKNPVMRAALQEPRTMAQEPRIGLATGSVSGDKAEFSKAWKDYNKSYRFSGPKGIKHRLSGAEFFKIWAKENMADGGSAGQLVRNTADGSRPGYQGPGYSSSRGTPGVKLNPKELKNIQDDLVNFDGLQLNKKGKSYYIRFRLQKGDNRISKQLTATPENIALVKKEQKAFMKTNYPNVLSNADFEQLRMLDENINLTVPEFVEVLNNKNKTTINGLPWKKDTVQKLQGELQLNDAIRPEFKGQKRKINVAKQIVRDYNPAELKRLNEIPDIDLRNKAIRKKAADVMGQSSQLKKTGTLQGITKNREGSLWKNFYESSKRNNRIKLGGTFNGKDLSFRKNWPRKADGSINWFIKDTETNKPAWQMLEFTDTQTPKGEFKFTYDGLQNQVDDAFGKGYFARSTNAYSSGRELYGKNIMFEGKMQPMGRVIAKQTIINNYKANNNGKVPTEKYIQDRIRITTPTQVHHTEGIGNNPYKVQLVSKDANQKLNAAELTYNGEIRKAKGDPTKIKSLNSEFKKTINQISNDYGGIKYDVDGTTVGKAATGESMYTSAVKESGMNEKQQMNLLKKMGYRCRKAGGAGEDVACYMSDVEQTRADMKSSDVTVRAKALTKQRKALQLAKQIPKLKNILKTGVQLGTAAITKPLQALGLTSGIGYAIEGLVEGGFYDNARRKGYSHEQAMAETLTPGLIAGRPEDVPWYGGSEKLREKELYEIKGRNEFIDVENRPPMQDPEFEKVIGTHGKVKQYVDALKEQDRIYSAIGKKEAAKTQNELAKSGLGGGYGGIPLADLDAASADVQDLARSGAYGRVDRTLAPESMASQAYNTAVEKRDALDQRRRTEYLEKFDPGALEREEKSLSRPSHLKKRYQEMEEYKGGREGIFGGMSRKKYEKYQEMYPELKNIPYEDVPKFGEYIETLGLKPEGVDKTYKEIFPTPASRYGWDLMGEIARAGGVANMAQGGIMNLKKKK